MSPQPDTEKITGGRLRQLLAQMNGGQPMGQNAAEAPKFDWSCPHHFGPDAWVMLNNIGKKTAACLEKTLKTLCHEKVQVGLKKIEQQFAYTMAEQTLRQDPPAYFLPVATGSTATEGFVGVQPQSAAILIAQTLRDPDAGAGSGGRFCLLEETILYDTVASVFDAAAAALNEYAELKLTRGQNLLRGDWPLTVRGMEDLCGFCFEAVWDEQKKAELSLMLPAEVFEPAVEHRPKTVKKNSPQENSRMVLQRMKDVPIEVTALLCRTSMPLEQLCGLETGDVLVLNKKTNEPLEVLFNGRPCVKAWPAQMKNQMAIMMA